MDGRRKRKETGEHDENLLGFPKPLKFAAFLHFKISGEQQSCTN